MYSRTTATHYSNHHHHGAAFNQEQHQLQHGGVVTGPFSHNSKRCPLPTSPTNHRNQQHAGTPPNTSPTASLMDSLLQQGMVLVADAFNLGGVGVSTAATEIRSSSAASSMSSPHRTLLNPAFIQQLVQKFLTTGPAADDNNFGEVSWLLAYSSSAAASPSTHHAAMESSSSSSDAVRFGPKDELLFKLISLAQSAVLESQQNMKRQQEYDSTKVVNYLSEGEEEVDTRSNSMNKEDDEVCGITASPYSEPGQLSAGNSPNLAPQNGGGGLHSLPSLSTLGASASFNNATSSASFNSRGVRVVMPTGVPPPPLVSSNSSFARLQRLPPSSPTTAQKKKVAPFFGNAFSSAVELRQQQQEGHHHQLEADLPPFALCSEVIRQLIDLTRTIKKQVKRNPHVTTILTHRAARILSIIYSRMSEIKMTQSPQKQSRHPTMAHLLQSPSISIVVAVICFTFKEWCQNAFYNQEINKLLIYEGQQVAQEAVDSGDPEMQEVSQIQVIRELMKKHRHRQLRSLTASRLSQLELEVLICVCNPPGGAGATVALSATVAEVLLSTPVGQKHLNPVAGSAFDSILRSSADVAPESLLVATGSRSSPMSPRRIGAGFSSPVAHQQTPASMQFTTPPSRVLSCSLPPALRHNKSWGCKRGTEEEDLGSSVIGSGENADPTLHLLQQTLNPAQGGTAIAALLPTFLSMVASDSDLQLATLSTSSSTFVAASILVACLI